MIRFLIAYAILALLLGLLAKSLMSALDRTFAPPAQQLPLIHAAVPSATDFVCTPVPRPPEIVCRRTREIV